MNPDPDMKPRTCSFDAIKKSTDLVRVIESYGVALKKAGQNHVGLCPFHEDHQPSLVVTPAKGLFHCPACGAAGNVIQFVAKKEGVSVKEAAHKLLGSIPGVKLGAALPDPVPVPVPDAALFNAVIDHYHETLLGRDRRGLDYLKKRGLGDVEMLKAFKLGFANGTLPKKLSPAQRKTLQACGLFNEAGNEKFYLRVIVPIHDEAGRPVGLYGRRLADADTGNHLYLEGGHRAVWHSQAAQVYPDELIITESILDALSIYTAGKKNVLAAYGAKGWTPHHAALIEKHRVKKIVLAFDNDKPGDEAARELAAKLTQESGCAAHRIHWPEGVKDANAYFNYTKALDFKGTPETFAALVDSAPRIGFSRPACTKLTVTERTDETVTIQNGSVSYRVKGMSPSGALRVVLAAKNDSAQHIDTLDLYGARSRKGFAQACAERLELDAPKIEEDLLALLDLLEGLRAEQAQPASVAGAPAMTPEEESEARALLQSPGLLDRIADDLETAGYVGEPRNKKLAYLIGTSRRLPKPLSGIFRAQSGSGKSYLMECVAELMPPEDVHYFSRLTPQALYYLEPDALTHKLLIVDERDGSEESEYPIRTLQTRKVLKLAVPIKDPNSGRIKTSVLEIHGPIAYMESTTDQRINPENANRCFELYLDESEKQTKAIFAAQRRARTLDGWKTERLKEKILRVHHNAQRLLRPLKVIIPYVDLIEFPPSWLRGRRDHDRFLSLIEGIAFLHQCQREIGSDNGADYLEASLCDYAAAYDLAHQVFTESQSDLARPVMEFLARVEAVVQAEAQKQKARLEEVWFNRRMIREAVKLPDHLIKRHMREIEDLEYVQVQRATSGGSFRYRLLAHKKTPAILDGLTPPDLLETAWKKRNNRVKSGNRA